MALLGGASGCSGKPSPEPPAASVVLIIADTLRADRLGCYGYFRRTSPRLDEFASGAALFENAVTPMATTLPAHVSLMTSTHPLRHGVEGNYEFFRVPFDSEEGGIRTAAQLFKAAGYGTAAFVSSASVKAVTGMGEGFETFDEPDGAERLAAETTDRALRWLDAGPKQPFFLWVHYFDPHGPYLPPPPYDLMFPDDEALRHELERKAFPAVGEKPLRDIQNLYDGEIAYMDMHAGRLFDGLKQAGVFESSLVVFTSDHGEGLGQHGWIDHGQIWNEQLFVPFLIKFPGASDRHGRRYPQLVSLLDILPTIAGKDAPAVSEAGRPFWEGRSVFEGNASLLIQRTPRGRAWGPGLLYALLTPEWKYFYGTETPHSLFDMRSDRIETRNLLAEHPAEAAAMKGEIEKRLARYASEKLHLPQGSAPSEEAREQLRSLGYVQ